MRINSVNVRYSIPQYKNKSVFNSYNTNFTGYKKTKRLLFASLAALCAAYIVPKQICKTETTETQYADEYTYTVQEGDTLSSIVRQYIGQEASWDEVSYYVDEIAADNNIDNPSNLPTKDKDGKSLVLDISSLLESTVLNFELPSKETPLTDSDGNIIASISKVNSSTEGELTGKTIMINAGHGGFNPENNIFDIGASDGELEEYELTNKYAKTLAQKLLDEGADIVICQGSVRGGSKSPIGNVISDFAQQMSDDLENTAFVSIHFDFYDNSDIKGGSVRYQKDTDSKFASIICDSLKENNIELFKNEPVEDGLLVTRTATSCGIDNAVLIECATLSNADDYNKIQTNEFEENLTNAIVEGIVQAFK